MAARREVKQKQQQQKEEKSPMSMLLKIKQDSKFDVSLIVYPYGLS